MECIFIDFKFNITYPSKTNLSSGNFYVTEKPSGLLSVATDKDDGFEDDEMNSRELQKFIQKIFLLQKKL